MQAIVKQLSIGFPGLPKPVVAGYRRRHRQGLASGSLEFQESYDLLVSLLELYPQTTIIIDALDESDSVKRGQILEVLTKIIHTTTTTLVKIFISSRDDIDIKLKLERLPNLYIQAQDNSEDIERFIHREMEGLISSQLSNLSDRSKTQIISTLVKKSNGMQVVSPCLEIAFINLNPRFQWASLQIKHLEGMRFEEDIIENLGKLPKSLKDTYSKILMAMHAEGTPREWEVTRKALMWIVCSRQLLSKELWTDISYWPKPVPHNGDNILFDLCRNLVTLDIQSRVVRFAHLSVQEYLDSQFTSSHSNTMAAESCLSLFDSIPSSAVANSTHLPSWESNSIHQGRHRGTSFADYSALYWPDHVARSYSRDENMSIAMASRLTHFLGSAAQPGQAYLN